MVRWLPTKGYNVKSARKTIFWLGLFSISLGMVALVFGGIILVLEVVLPSRYPMYREMRAAMVDVDHRLRPNGSDVNEDGIRSRRTSGDISPDDLSVVVLGDSFVYGWRLKDYQALPQQFERAASIKYPDLRIKVANFGWPSSSPLLSLGLIKDIGKKYRPDYVVLCLDMTDFDDDIIYDLAKKKRGPFRWAHLAPGTVFSLTALAALASCSSETTAWLFEELAGFPGHRYLVTKMPLSETGKYFRNTVKNIDQIYNYCRDHLGATFVLAILPRSFQYSAGECPHSWERGSYGILGPHCLEPFRYFQIHSKRVDYPIVSLLDAFKRAKTFPLYFPDDPHWNEAGCKTAAEALLQFFERQGYFTDAKSRGLHPEPHAR
ncbi:MAG: hypothetical protein V1792_22625 [Pseudomonadota bacterium]